MICIDTIDGEAKNMTGAPTAHLFSDEPGREGQDELLSFAREIGLHPQWIQHAGMPREHFDVWGSKIDAALENGAEEVGPRGMVEIIQEKRETHEA